MKKRIPHLLIQGVLIAGLTTGLVFAQQKSSVARIKIDTDRTIGQIDKMIYGNFIEHLGRCIEGGVFQEGSPLSAANGYRNDVFEAVKGLQVSILRWPGGNFASGYHWEDGIGPRNQRPARLELAWGTTESNRFGTHEFLNYCELLGTQPYICVNVGTGSWDEAKFWVEYCNVKGGTRYSDWRRKNGREKPWGVVYWGLGNEMDGPWQMGHRSAEDYGRFDSGGAGRQSTTSTDLYCLGRVERLVPGAWRKGTRAGDPGREIQPGRCPGRSHVPEYLRE